MSMLVIVKDWVVFQDKKEQNGAKALSEFLFVISERFAIGTFRAYTGHSDWVGLLRAFWPHNGSQAPKLTLATSRHKWESHSDHFTCPSRPGLDVIESVGNCAAGNNFNCASPAFTDVLPTFTDTGHIQRVLSVRKFISYSVGMDSQSKFTNTPLVRSALCQVTTVHTNLGVYRK